MEYLVGQIVLLPYGFNPVDFLKCDGSTLPVQQYEMLYSLLGAKFGGDGRTQFKLPDLRGAEPIPGMAYYIAINGIYPQRS